MLGHLIRLPPLARESQSLVAVILVVCLILVVLDADEIALYGFGVQGECDQRIDSGGLGNDLEGPRLSLLARSE